LRAYRLYLAVSAIGFEEGWMALHQTLASHPGRTPDNAELPGAGADYPFNRAYMYA
jgi:cyclopropane-fatty-acyl-phospholipid synthase